MRGNHHSFISFLFIGLLRHLQTLDRTNMEEASLLVPTESGRGGFESLLEHDSKAQPPVCTHWVSLHIAATRPRTEAGRSNGLWFQSFFVIWRPQQGGIWREFPPLNCGGNSRRAIHLSSRAREFRWMSARRGRARIGSPPKISDLRLVISAASSSSKAIRPLVAFHRNKKPP